MILSFLFMEYVALPSRSDAIFANIQSNKLNIYSSGSIGLYFQGKCHKTNPNYTLIDDEMQDWCSNVVKRENPKQEISNDQKPFVTFNIQNKAFQLNSYAIRSGCCRRICCCIDDGTFLGDEGCCCRLYSFSLLGSNDNKTWITLHSVNSERNLRICEARTYEIQNQKQSFRFIRFQMDGEWPGCPFCMQLNQIEFYGSTIHTGYYEDYEYEESEEEAVSIIGKIRREE